MQGLLDVFRRGAADIIDRLQRNAVLLLIGATAVVLIVAATAGIMLRIVVLFGVHRLAIFESFGQIGIEHDAASRGLIVAQCFGHGIENRSLRLGYQGIAHYRSI